MYTQIYTLLKARDVVKNLMDGPPAFRVSPLPLGLVAVRIEERKSYLLPDSDYHNMYPDQKAFVENYFVI